LAAPRRALAPRALSPDAANGKDPRAQQGSVYVKLLVKNFLNGCLVIVPSVATLYVVYLVFLKIDGMLGLQIPGLGFVITIALITGVGAAASTIVGRRLVGLPDRLLTRLPLIKLIYSSLRDFVAALVGQKKTFDRPVVATLGEDGALKAFGFATREDLADFGLPDHVAVYLPQSINFAGQLVLLPRSRVRFLEVEASQMFPLIVSAGVAGR
jgi:uncharacterized membrane protein